jgi:glutathione-regulated potassium-efflux system ancillary protein KefG
MIYLPPFVVHGTNSMSEQEYRENGILYGKVLNYLEKGDLKIDELMKYPYFNDWFQTNMK